MGASMETVSSERERASDVDVTILIPMAGDGARFREVGFLKPKPVIDVAGKPMIIWVIENILPKSLDIKAEIIGTRQAAVHGCELTHCRLCR